MEFNTQQDQEAGTDALYKHYSVKSSQQDNDTQGNCFQNSNTVINFKQMRTLTSVHSIDGDNNINNQNVFVSDCLQQHKQMFNPHHQNKTNLCQKSYIDKLRSSLHENLNDKTINLNIPNSSNKIIFRICWTPINQLLCCCLIGHVGISNTSGVVYDFKNNFFIGAEEGDNELRLFGRPTKDLYLELDTEEQAHRLQDILKNKYSIYTSKEAVVGQYKLLKNNCHHFVADVLNTFKYKERSDYTALWVWRQTLIRGKYRNCKGFLKTWFSPLVILLLGFILLIVFLIDLYYHLNIFHQQ